MKKIYVLPFALIILITVSCSMRSTIGMESQNAGLHQGIAQELFAVMKIRDTIKIGDPIELKFTVYNHSDSLKRFLRWQTPFEPLMSKYLNIKNEQGEECLYRGPMAKRMMPPPVSAYISLNPKDSLVVKVDVLKGYVLEKAGKYSINYTSESVSGLKVRGQADFIYK